MQHTDPAVIAAEWLIDAHLSEPIGITEPAAALRKLVKREFGTTPAALRA